jgi:alcohol dehydrogenase (cytochrome c)
VIVLLFVLPLLGYAEENRPKNNQVVPLPPVTAERLLKGTDDPTAWLMYGGNYQSWRFSALPAINRRNVKKLQVAWIFQTGVAGTLQASPI